MPSSLTLELDQLAESQTNIRPHQNWWRTHHDTPTQSNTGYPCSITTRFWEHFHLLQFTKKSWLYVFLHRLWFPSLELKTSRGKQSTSQIVVGHRYAHRDTTFDAISFVEAVSGYSMWDCFGFSSVARAHCWLCEETMFHMKIENVSCSSEECASDIMYFINNTHGSCGQVKLKRRMQRWAASHLVSFAASGGSNCLLRTTLDELCILLILLHILDGAP